MPSTPSASITVPRGFQAAGTACGIKPSGKPDLALIVANRPCVAAGQFTRNRFPGAPVIVARRHIRSGSAAAIVCNSGVANVATGPQGLRDARSMCRQVAAILGCRQQQVLPCSTGVIGPRLPMEKVAAGIDAAAAALARGRQADAAAARAILTTDLVPKSAQRTVGVAGARRPVHLGGIAKGSGMIAPNMATMLAFITSDAALEPEALRAALTEAVNASFNRISVDGDTSTSDAVLVLASGQGATTPISGPGRRYNAFVHALGDLCQDLAEQLVKDGEGATRVFTVDVQHAANQRDADRVGKSIANSPLVKSAVNGADPNWGRLVMAVGKSGARVVPEKLSLAIGDVVIFRHGVPVPIAARNRQKLMRLMRRKQVSFNVDLNLGSAASHWLGCDLSHQYVTINAQYTT